jgi:hypothetical protein
MTLSRGGTSRVKTQDVPRDREIKRIGGGEKSRMGGEVLRWTGGSGGRWSQAKRYYRSRESEGDEREMEVER